jgi:predicted transcriptional regulator
MTMTIDISPETEAWLEAEAQKRGQEREVVAKMALEAFSARQREEEAESALVADWQALSYRSLWEVWDNEEDAVYDKL